MSPRVMRTALLAAVLAFVAHVGSARAEIVDFNPQEDEVQEILSAEDFEKIQRLSGTRFAALRTEPSPSGRYALMWGANQFIDLDSSDRIDVPEETPGFISEPGVRSDQVMATTWLGPDTLGLLVRAVFFPQTEEDEVTFQFFRVTIELADGQPEVDSVELPEMADIPGNVVAIAPDLERVVVMRPADDPGGFMPDPVEVTLGESPYQTHAGPDEGLPTDLPGLTGQHPLGTLEVQQVNFELDIVGVDGSTVSTIDFEGEAGTALAGVGFNATGNHVYVVSRSMPGWDGDRQRDNYPPAEGLPNLGSVNVQEALGLIDPAFNPLVIGTYLHFAQTETGALIKRYHNIDLPQGLISGVEFAPGGDRAVLVLAARSELADREFPTYAYPSGLEIHELDGDYEIVGQVEVPGFASLMASGTFVDEDTLVMTVPDGLNSQVVAYDFAAGQSEVIWDRDGTLLQTFPRSGGMVMGHSTVDQPWELYVYGSAAEGDAMPEDEELSVRRVTHMNDDAAAASDLRTSGVSWETSDGQAMEGIVVHHASQQWPPNEPGPIVVWQQGGPGGQISNAWGASVESPYSLLPNLGIPVMMANAAGRMLEPDFFSDMAQGRNFGQLDIAQIKEGVDAMIADGSVDADRVGITGCSYGGYFTLQSLRTYPDYYAAGNAQCSLNDLFEEFTFGYTPFVSYLMGRAPMHDAEEYLKDSPLFGSKDITAPTLLFHGTEDFLPVQLINNLHDQLETNGTPVTFLRVAGEGHGFGNPASQAQAAQMQVAFFREHLEVGEFEPPEVQPIYLPTLMRNYEPADPEPEAAP